MIGNVMSKQRILVIGVTSAGQASLPPLQCQRILQADLIVGGDRQLGFFADAAGETLNIRRGIGVVAERLRQARDAGQRAVVVASGDPLCYGIGTSLRRYFAPEELEIIPAPSAFQLAFAALAEPWQDAALLSAHTRPLEAVLQELHRAPKSAILTDPHHTPTVIAQALLDAGWEATTPCAVCENLALPDERIVRATLAEVAMHEFAPLNVCIVWKDRGEEEGA